MKPSFQEWQNRAGQQLEHSCRTKSSLDSAEILSQEGKRRKAPRSSEQSFMHLGNGYRVTFGCVEPESPPEVKTLQFPADRGAFRSSETLGRNFYNTFMKILENTELAYNHLSSRSLI